MDRKSQPGVEVAGQALTRCQLGQEIDLAAVKLRLRAQD